MFKNIQLLISNGPFKQAFQSLIREIQKRISATYVHNTSGLTLVRGQNVAYTTGDREVALSDATSESGSQKSARGIGVVLKTSVPNGAWFVMRTDDLTYQLFEPDLDPPPVAGDPVFLSSATPGLATNVEPVGGGDFVTKIGTVADGTIYAAETACYIEQKYCCEPVVVEQM